MLSLKSFKRINAWLLLFLFIQTAQLSFAQESETELKENAAKLFDSEKFVEATSLYLRLIALNPRSTEYNYRYGTCLLFNSNRKQDAFKYLNYSVTDPTIAPAAYFYLGKAYHLNFQFNEAIKNYNIYIQKSGGNPNPNFETSHQIEMCQNGKKLLTTISDLVVLEKKEIEYASFFRLYNLSNIGGVNLITADYQSKIDKKKNHIPLIHFPDKAQTIYYSSYGDSDKGSKDIYCRRRLPDGKWGLPSLVTGNVNTKYDEDFPYLSPNGQYLYFCSKGHNSMGGFDIYRSKFDFETNSFGDPENMDFAISSPDNDLFYVVDSLEKNAYFASTRQSENGKIHVYKVRVDRVPLQLAIIKGDFISTINPENKKVTIKVVDFNSGDEIGVFKSNDKGKYLITLPKAGKYTYEMTVDGSTSVHKSQVTIPILKEFKPLKQKIQEELLNKEDVVRVVDQFNEEVEDAQGILAEVIRARAELNVNAGNFDILALDSEKENKKVLADIGLEGASNQEIISKFEGIQQKQGQKLDGLRRLETGSLVAIVDKAIEAENLQAEVKKDVARANAASTNTEKNEILLAANDKVEKILELKEEIQRIDQFVDSISKLIPKEQEKLQSITALKETVSKSVIDEKFDQLKDAVVAKADLVKSIESEKETHPVDNLLAQNETLGKQSEQLKKQLKSYKENDQNLVQELKALKTELGEAKSKDQSAIQSKIDAKEAEQKLVAEEVKRLTDKVAEIHKVEVLNTKEITFINNLQHTNDNRTVTKAEADAKVDEINANNVRSLEAYVKQQVKSIDTTEITARSNDVLVQESKERIEEFEADYSLAQTAVDKQSDLTHEEKVALKIQNNEQLDKKLTQELSKIDEGLAKNPTDSELKKQKEKVLALKTENLSNKETILTEAQLPINVSTTPEKELTALVPNYETLLKNAGNESDVEAKLKAENQVDEMLLDQVDQEMERVYESLTKDPLNQKLQDKKEALISLKKQKEGVVKERQDKLDELQTAKNDQVAAVSIEKELNQVAPNYEEEKKVIGTKNGLEELKALNQLETKVNESINKELTILNLKTDPVSTKRKEVLGELRKQFEENISSRNETIKELTTTASKDPINPTDNNAFKEILPSYNENIATIEAGTSTGLEKSQLIIEEESKLLTAINQEQDKLKKIIGKNPTDSLSINTLLDLNELETLHESKLDELKQTAISQAKAKLKDEQVRQEILPTYQMLSQDEIQRLNPDQAKENLLQEKELQTALEKQIQANKKSLDTKFSAEKTAENQVLTDLLQQSKETEEELKAVASKTPIATTTTKEIASLNVVLGKDYEFAMTQKPANKEEASKQLQILNELSESIELKLDEEKRSETRNESHIQIFENQLASIKARKETVNSEFVQIVEVKTPKTENPESDLAQLKSDEKQLKTELTNATPKGKTEIEKKLAENHANQQKIELAIQEKQVTELKAKSDEKKVGLEEIETTNPLKEVVLSRTAEKLVSEDKIFEKTSQITLIEASTDFLLSQKAFEETNQIVQTETALKEQRRRFSIEIGELESEMEQSKSDSKRTEELKLQRKALQDAIAKIDQQLVLLDKEKSYDLINDPALSKSVSVEEEQKIASSKEYPELREQQQAINRLKESANQTQNSIVEKRKEYVLATNSTEKERIQTQIQQLGNELAAQNKEIVSKETVLNTALNNVDGDKEAWKNVLTREVQPKTAVSTSISEVLAPEVGSGFEIKKENGTEPRTIKKVIPLGIKAPTGLVYRVQVGAFAKPIPEDLFKEFTPVTGEKLDNGITRYLAGYFGNRQKVLDAQQAIRGIGYKDAFVVAYCDGKRISLAEARQLEEQGLCKPMRQDSIVMEVIQNTIAQLPLDTIAKYKTEPKVSDYNKAPGAVSAIAIEEIKGLFFTVQVGVYNRPATKEQLRDINPLVTRRLENGQIRYSTGTFRSVDAARPKKAEAVEKGVLDAFITAYYDGERISLQEAKKLLADQGEAVLFKEQELPKVEETPVSDQVVKDYAKANPLIEKPVFNQYALVSQESYSEYPRKIMNQLRIQGDFYFDQTDLRIKTQLEEALPKLVNSTILFDTIVQKPLISADINEPNRTLVVGIWDFKEISGSWANWLLRLTLPYEVKTSSSIIEISMNVSGEEERKKVEALFTAQGGRLKTE
ncbi:PD40 domain-containing protein [Fluviicola taffensis]|uniref:WD40-like beta Propeller containing protein n=1 Tax=Fluviicola taffensis (strain DSM 16823 / NCIMB 13979 / RW262) TaxID=755732 RepID=F2I9G6_FLUTR|nr:PD40 domain-containing protein [Fluviicola taffensis]AEA45147.1 WD40-like beta Propeller containing protein [Fluviicola taffensis DSM 16823]